MKWKADKSTGGVALIAMIAGVGRIYFNHDYILGGALIAVGVIIAIRIAINLRRSRP